MTTTDAIDSGDTEPKVALITGGAQRIGAQLSRALHARGFNVAIHYNRSAAAAARLADELNAVRPDSALIMQADLTDHSDVSALSTAIAQRWQRLDALINNASSYYATPWGRASEHDWDALIGSNLKGAFFLTQTLLPALTKQRGCVLNLVDIFAERPLPEHPLYCIAKAGLAMLTKSLALDCGDRIRVNGIAPGAILWPEPELSAADKQRLLDKIPRRQIGEPGDIVRTALFLIEDAPYINGQIIAVDGGLSLHT